MIRIQRILIILCLGFPLFAGGGKEDVREAGPPKHPGNAEEILEVRPLDMGDNLTLDLGTGGSIWISVSGKEEVSMKIYKYGTAVEQGVVDINESPEGIRIKTWYRKEPRTGRNGINFELTVPSSCNLSLETLGGDIAIDGVSGVIEGNTLGGSLFLSNLYGEIRMETLGGDIDISSSNLNGKVNTLGGDIRVKELEGNLNADTLGGKVTYFDSIPGTEVEPIKVDSLGGNIDIDEAPAGIDAKTLGGNITIGRASDFVNAETLGGNIRIRDIDGRIHASTLGGEVNAVMTGNPASGNREAILKSLGGDITLTVPEGLSMDIEIILEISGRTLRNYRIFSDFDLITEEREATPQEKENNIRRVITARGETGEGRHRINLTTINGNISLKRGD